MKTKKNNTKNQQTDFHKEVYIRNLTENDNLMLRNLRNITHNASNTQALLTAGYEFLEYKTKFEQLQQKFNTLDQKFNDVKYSLIQIKKHREEVNKIININVSDENDD